MEDYDVAIRMKEMGYKPGRTGERITTSTRRYDGSWYSVMVTEYRMWKLRKDYRKGIDVEDLSRQYPDVR